MQGKIVCLERAVAMKFIPLDVVEPKGLYGCLCVQYSSMKMLNCDVVISVKSSCATEARSLSRLVREPRALVAWGLTFGA